MLVEDGAAHRVVAVAVAVGDGDGDLAAQHTAGCLLL